MNVMFDIDGTLTTGPGHQLFIDNPEEWENQLADAPLNEPIVHTLKAMHGAGHTIVLATARPTYLTDVTKAWLEKHDIPYHTLIMRYEMDLRFVPLAKLDRMIQADLKPDLVFEDSQSAIDYFRIMGYSVCAVADYGLRRRFDEKHNN